MEVYRRIVVGGGEEGDDVDDIGGTADSVAETSDLPALLCRVCIVAAATVTHKS